MQKIVTFLLVIITTFLFFTKEARSQDVHFSQFYASPQSFNPGTTGGMTDDFRFNTHYKDQWRSIGSPYKTIFASFDAKVGRRDKKKKHNFGLGANFFSDKAGSAQMGLSQLNLSASYHIRLDRENRIGGAIQGGLGQRSINTSNLQWDNQFDGDTYDPTRNSQENITFPTFLYPDVAAGIYFDHMRDESLKANAGIAVHHINKPPQSHYNLYGDYLFTKFVFHMGTEITIENTNTAVLPQLLFMKQGPFFEINLGGMMKYQLGLDSRYTGLRTSSAVYFGAYYRFQDAITLVTRYDFKQNWAAGFSYDINVSKLRVASAGRGGIEISLAYRGLFNQ